VFPVVSESETTRPDCTLLIEYAVALTVPVIGVITPIMMISTDDSIIAATDLIRICPLPHVIIL
jgi:hypothetical protein